MKKIPSDYLYSPPVKSGGRFRELSPIGKKLGDMVLEEIACPLCGMKALAVHNYGTCTGFDDSFVVVCDECDWEVPYGEISDYGEATVLLKSWLEAFYLCGEPKEFVHENLTLLFYPEVFSDEFRNIPCNNSPKCYYKHCDCEGCKADKIKCGKIFSDEVNKEILQALADGETVCEVNETIEPLDYDKVRLIDLERFLLLFDEMIDADKKGEVFTKTAIRKIKTLADNLAFPHSDFKKETDLFYGKDV